MVVAGTSTILNQSLRTSLSSSDCDKYNFKSITADETEFMFLMLCPCLDGLVDASVAALNAHRG